MAAHPDDRPWHCSNLEGVVLVFQSGAASDWPAFMPAICVMGPGMGGISAPMSTEDMPTMLAGAASG